MAKVKGYRPRKPKTAGKLHGGDKFDVGDISAAMNYAQNVMGNLTELTSAGVKDISKELKTLLKSVGGSYRNLAELLTKTTKFKELISKKGGASMKEVSGYFTEALNLTGAIKEEFEEGMIEAVSLSRYVRDFASEAAENLTKPFDLLIKNIEKLPGGSMLSQALGLNDIAEDIRNNITNEIRQSMLNGESAAVSFGKATKTAISGIGSAIKVAFSNPFILGLTAILGLSYVIYKQWGKFMDAAKGVRDQTGLTAADSLEVAKTARDVAMEWGQIGVDMEVAGKSASALVNEFQIIDAANKELVTGVGVMVGTLGVAEGSAAKVARLFEVMAGSSGATTKQMAAAVSNAAKLGGIAPAKVFEDMAQSTKEIQTYFKGSFTAAAKAAIELRRMGTSIKEAAASAKSMVDFESSIGSELEASVLLGRQLDFGAARYYAFMGDIENQQKAVLKQVGSLEEFNKMMPFQKEAIAKAAGMEVDQLGNMLKQQKILAGMDSTKKAKYEEGLKSLEKMQEVNEDTLLIENQRLFAQEKMKKIWDTILIALAPIFDFIYDALEVISDIIQGIQKAVGSGLTFVFLGLAAIIGGVLYMSVKKFGKAMAEAVSDKISGKASGLFKKILPSPKEIASAKTSTGKMGGIGKSIGQFFEGFREIKVSDILKFALVLGVLAGGLYLFGLALKGFNDVKWDSVFKGMLAMGTMAVMAKILQKATSDMIVGAIGLAAMAGALYLFGLALEPFKDIKWETLAIAGVAIVGFAAAVFALGAIMMTGVGALLFAAGLIGIIALAGAIGILGLSFMLLEKGKGGMNVMIDGITKLGALGANLFIAAAGIAAIGYALAAFGGGSVLAGIGSFIGNFLGGDPIAKLERLAAIGPNLNIAAIAIKELSASLSNFTIPDIGDIDNLSEIADVAVKAKYNAATNVNVAAPDNSGIIAKLDEMINRIESLEIKMDGKTVGEVISNATTRPGFA